MVRILTYEGYYASMQSCFIIVNNQIDDQPEVDEKIYGCISQASNIGQITS